jgi:hypothetical protein
MPAEEGVMGIDDEAAMEESPEAMGALDEFTANIDES